MLVRAFVDPQGLVIATLNPLPNCPQRCQKILDARFIHFMRTHCDTHTHTFWPRGETFPLGLSQSTVGGMITP